MCLRIVTVAGDLYELPEQHLIMKTHLKNEAIIILSDETTYFEEIEQVMKIRNFTKQHSISTLSASILGSL